MPAKISKAMVLAAGYGLRLRPLTLNTPKPLVPVAGRPMIDYALDRLRTDGIRQVVINVSYLKEQLIRHLAACTDFEFRISEEPEPLETGGGLKHALPHLGSEPFFTINSDILWFDRGASALSRLAGHWDDSGMDALLLVQPRAKANGYDQGEDHLFVKPMNTLAWNHSDAPYIIAGIGILHPRILRDAPDGKFSVKTLWRRALDQNRLFCLPHYGAWFQTGTCEDIRRAEEQLSTNLCRARPPGARRAAAAKRRARRSRPT